MSFKTRSLLTKVAPMFLIGFVFIGAGVSNASGQSIINTILARMDAHNKALTSLRGNVTRVDANSQLGTFDTRQGKMAYLPKKGSDPAVRIDWTGPNELLTVIDKKYVIYRPDLKQAYVGSTESRKKDSSRGAGALAFMNMSRTQLKENYTITYLGEEEVKGGAKTWHLQMTPKTRTSYKHADVWVDGNGMPIQSKVTEHNDDSTTILLTNLQKNVKVSGSEFKFDPPSGTKIIQG